MVFEKYFGALSNYFRKIQLKNLCLKGDCRKNDDGGKQKCSLYNTTFILNLFAMERYCKHIRKAIGTKQVVNHLYISERLHHPNVFVLQVKEVFRVTICTNSAYAALLSASYTSP